MPSATAACSSSQGRPHPLPSDGSVLAILSCSPNLLPGVDNRNSQIFLLSAAGFELVSASALNPGSPSNGDALSTVVSSDGSLVVFSSEATDLVPGYVGDFIQVYVFDRATGSVRLVSHAWTGTAAGGNSYSWPLSISDDNRFLLLGSGATDLLAGYSGDGAQVYLVDLVTNEVRLVSHAPGNATVGADDFVGQASMDSSAARVVYAGRATNLISGYEGSNFQVFAWDRASDSTTLISHAAGYPNQGCKEGAAWPEISRGGDVAVFESSAPDLLATWPGPDNQIYVHDFSTGALELLTSDASNPGIGANQSIAQVAISADGRYAAVTTIASNLVAPIEARPYSSFELILFDRLTGDRRLVSRAFDDGTPGNGSSWQPVMAPSGSLILFQSEATDLVSGYSGLGYQLYSFTLATGEIHLLSHPPGLPATGSRNGDPYFEYAISGEDGSVVFSLGAWDLVPNDWDGGGDAFASDSAGSDPVLLTRRPSELLPSRTAAAGSSIDAWHRNLVTADGRFALFKSYAANLAPGLDRTCDWCERVFLYDAALDRVELLDRAGLPLSEAVAASISGDGRWLAIQGRVPGASFYDTDVFLWDRVTATIKLASRSWADPRIDGDAISDWATVALNAPIIVFKSEATNLVPGYSGTGRQTFVYDGNTQTVELISHAAGTPATAGSAESFPVGISQEGRWVFFQSSATDLLPGYSGTGGQVYRYDRWTSAIELVSHALGSATTGADQSAGALDVSQDGGKVLLLSSSANLIGAAAPATTFQLFLWSAQGSTISLVSHSAAGTAQFSNGPVRAARTSGDGSAVVFASEATDLLAGYSGSGSQVYLADPATGETRLLSHSIQGPAIGCSYGAFSPAISSDGSRSAFVSPSWDLIPNSFSYQMNVYAVDRDGVGDLEFLTPPLYPAPPSWQLQEWPLDISGDGRTILFNSEADNLVARDWNWAPDAFLSIRWPPGTIFADSFESGDSTRWSSQTNDG